MENRIVRLGDVITANYGRALPKKNRVSGKIPVYGSSGVTDYHNRSIVDGPAIIIGRKGNIGSVFLTENSFYPIDTTYYVTREDLKDLDIYFAYYLLQFLPLQEMNTDSAVPGLNRNNLYSIPVKIPDLATQVTVADILQTIDKKIQLNQQIDKNLLKLIDGMFNRAYLGSELVENASRVKLSSIIRTKSGTFNPKKSSEVFVNHFSMPAFDATRFPIVDAASDIKSNKNVVEPFSILVSKMNPDVKRVWLPNTSKELLNVASTEFLTFNADVPEMQAFVYAVVNDKRYQKYLESNTTGSTNSRQRVLPRVAYSYEIPYVKEAAQQFGFQIMDIIDMIKLNKEQNQHLIRLRNVLLPKLLAGDIDLSNIETVMNNNA
ncbi:restriction endonuclease subunit S [Furfurilactobacillus rossiae]|uniref:restriction endonuclease subunit S n=1 Tax=Furfurilactobacillus rossiae TaxID=231049 RepID=UPI000309F10B|nr:restriction endonuclease subunit S [Furfurilactobacillus rossiae]QFR68198.1 hypothetical protein LR814_13605 [Furfurilactobacillus rossiae]QLE62648.1 Type I restriction-modification system specificity subunit S [Furfurilactobacillus rossiae]